MNIFYVYEHWRPDKGVCFWVGKGKGRRAQDFSRNSHYNRVRKKLLRLGMRIEVRIVASDLSECDAHKLERDRIAYWRAKISLARTGKKYSPHSPEHREKIGAANRGRKDRPEIIAKKQLAARNRPPLSTSTKMKIAHSVRRLWNDPQYREKISAGQKRRPQISEETRAKMSASQQARGKVRPDAHRAKISASIKMWHASRAAIASVAVQ